MERPAQSRPERWPTSSSLSPTVSHVELHLPTVCLATLETTAASAFFSCLLSFQCCYHVGEQISWSVCCHSNQWLQKSLVTQCLIMCMETIVVQWVMKFGFCFVLLENLFKSLNVFLQRAQSNKRKVLRRRRREGQMVQMRRVTAVRKALDWRSPWLTAQTTYKMVGQEQKRRARRE